MKKKILNILTALTMILSLTGVLPAVTASADTTSGTCGDNVTWTYDSDTSTLTLSGTGATYNYMFSGDQPYSNYAARIITVVVQNGITKLGNGAFSDMHCLKNVSLPNSLTSIGDIFFNCISLTEITLPNSLKNIGKSAFQYCSNLKEITIPNSVTSIGDQAFSGCTSLESVTIGNDVTKIGNYAFEKCTNLKEITIPESVTKLGTLVTDLEDLTIYCYSGSYAEYIAKEYNVNYVTIGQSTNPYVPTTATTAANKTAKTKSSSEKAGISASRKASRIAVKAREAEKAMKQAKITKLTVKSKAKRTINVTWKKVSTAKGYQVQVSKNKKFKTNKIIFDKHTSKKTLNLKRAIFKSGKKYYVRVRAYTAYTNIDNERIKVYSAWNKKLRKVTVK